MFDNTETNVLLVRDTSFAERDPEYIRTNRQNITVLHVMHSTRFGERAPKNPPPKWIKRDFSSLPYP